VRNLSFSGLLILILGGNALAVPTVVQSATVPEPECFFCLGRAGWLSHFDSSSQGRIALLIGTIRLRSSSMLVSAHRQPVSISTTFLFLGIGSVEVSKKSARIAWSFLLGVIVCEGAPLAAVLSDNPSGFLRILVSIRDLAATS